ncbi:hypothetical protein AVM02_09480 [Brucella anthropi]
MHWQVQVKYLNSVIETDRGWLKQRIRPVRGFKALKTAYVMIKAFEAIRALHKGQAAIFTMTGDAHGAAPIVELGLRHCAERTDGRTVALLVKNVEDQSP